MSKAKLGDVIAVDRFGYKHFGVYSGNNKVVHYNKQKMAEVQSWKRQ